MTEDDYPRLHLREPFDLEITAKGWYSGAVAELPGGTLYSVVFFDGGRLAQELESAVQRGSPCLDEEALIVVPEITEASMRAALKFLFARGWFDRLVPSKGKTPLEVLTQPSFTLLQGQYLAFIAAYTKVNGLAPAEADMQKFFRVSAPSVHSMVLTLERRGLIARQVGKARSIQVAVPRELLPALD